MFSGIATYLFGTSTEEDNNAQRSALLTETEIKGFDGEDWILIAVGKEERTRSGRGLGIDKVTTTTTVPQERELEPSPGHHLQQRPDATSHLVPERTEATAMTLTPRTFHNENNNAAATTTCGAHSNNNNGAPNGAMEGSWFVTPPPCFTHPNTFTMESSPLENILIEHPSISVYSPRPAPLDMDSPLSVSTSSVKSSSSRQSLANFSGNTKQQGSSNRGSLAEVTNLQGKQGRRSQNRPPRPRRAQVGDLSAQAGLLAEAIRAIEPMQKAKQDRSQQYLNKSFLERQNQVVLHLNRHPTRRSKLTMRPNGYSNNRKVNNHC